MKLFVSCLILCVVGLLNVHAQDSPEIAAAKAAHFEAVRRAELVIANGPPPAIKDNQRPAVVETTQHKLGLNVYDTPEVAAAKVAHYEAVRDAEHATAVANSTGKVPVSNPIHHAVAAHHPESYYPAPVPVHHSTPVNYQAPVSHHQSAPVIQTTQHQLGVNVQDTPEVAAAKAAHYESVLRAEQIAASFSGSYDDGSYMMVPRYQEPAPIIPVAPVVQLRDTPEVAAARAAHFEALRRAELTAGPRFTDQIGQYVPMAQQVMYMPVTYNQNYDYNRMVPVVAVPQTNQHKLGLNVQDTPEVAAAKAAHFEAFQRAQLAAADNELEYPAGAVPSNSYYVNPTRLYGQVHY